MKVLVLLSGGMDSATLLYVAKATSEVPLALSFNYGQLHARELIAATQVAKAAGVRHEIASLGDLGRFMRRGALTGGAPVPEGHYADASMQATVVPNRNMILLALAGAAALTHDCDTIAYAAHAGDHAIYPDCRPEFIRVMRSAFTLCDYHPLTLWAPFERMSKAEIVHEGANLGVPYGLTWSCYKGGAQHCGKCGTDVERREAFQLAGVPDPTEYAA